MNKINPFIPPIVPLLSEEVPNVQVINISNKKLGNLIAHEFITKYKHVDTQFMYYYKGSSWYRGEVIFSIQVIKINKDNVLLSSIVRDYELNRENYITFISKKELVDKYVKIFINIQRELEDSLK